MMNTASAASVSSWSSFAWRSSVTIIGTSSPTALLALRTTSASGLWCSLAAMAPWRARKTPSSLPASLSPSAMPSAYLSKHSGVSQLPEEPPQDLDASRMPTSSAPSFSATEMKPLRYPFTFLALATTSSPWWTTPFSKSSTVVGLGQKVQVSCEKLATAILISIHLPTVLPRTGIKRERVLFVAPNGLP